MDAREKPFQTKKKGSGRLGLVVTTGRMGDVLRMTWIRALGVVSEATLAIS
jgi:hypothetical protein